MNKPITVDIGDLCTHCGRDTSFQAVDDNGKYLSLFVNRIGSDADGQLLLTSGESDVTIPVTVAGYMCIDCQRVECDRCGQLTIDYAIDEHGNLLCAPCEEAVA